MNYLQADPTEVTYPTAQEAFQAFTRLATAVWNSWYPFVPQSYIWNPNYSISAYLWRPFAPFLCPSCNPQDPFLPPEPSQTVAPQPQQTLTLDVPELRAALGSGVGSPSAPQVGIASTEVVSPDAKQNGLAGADIAKSPASTPTDVLTTVTAKVAPEPAQSGLDAATEATEPASTTPSAPVLDLPKDGNKVEPIQIGPKHRAPGGGGLTGGLTSVRDAINSTISKITGGLTGGNTTTSGEASTGNTGG
jgi:hypothetical protein